MIKTEFIFAGKKITITGYAEDDWIFTTIKNQQTFYEIDLLRYMRFALPKQQGVIFDVGANIGNHSVFFGSIMNNKVVCFEPNPPIYQILQDNLSHNNIEHLSFQIGLGTQKSQFSIDDDHQGAQSNIGAAKLYHNSDGEIRVEAMDDICDDILKDNEHLVAIKADIEGMEAQMLKGAIKTLAKHQPDLFLEINEQVQMNDIKNILIPLGYKKLYAYAGTPVWHFSHQSRLSSMRRIKLSAYDKFVNCKQFVAKLLRLIQLRST